MGKYVIGLIDFTKPDLQIVDEGYKDKLSVDF